MHIQHGNDRGDLRLDRKASPANNRPTETPVFDGELLRIPFDPSIRLAKSTEEFLRPIGQPRIIKFPGVVEILFYRLKKLNRLAFHERARRCSSSDKVIRLVLPLRYDVQRSSKIFLCNGLAGSLSSTPENHNASASFIRWRLGRLASSGNLARVMPAM